MGIKKKIWGGGGTCPQCPGASSASDGRRDVWPCETKVDEPACAGGLRGPRHTTPPPPSFLMIISLSSSQALGLIWEWIQASQPLLVNNIEISTQKS